MNILDGQKARSKYAEALKATSLGQSCLGLVIAQLVDVPDTSFQVCEEGIAWRFLSLTETPTGILGKLVFSEGRPRVSVAEQSRNTRGTQLSLKCSPARLPTNYPPHDWHLDYGAPIG
jgi:hypothetical protein